MSYYIELCDPVTGDVLQASQPHQMAGGTYVIGGTRDLCLNVTYNYARHYERAFGGEQPQTDFDKLFGGTLLSGVQSIYGKTGAESIPMLDAAIAALGDDTDPDYWKPTEGNAKRALIQLRAMAQMRPDGVWYGD